MVKKPKSGLTQKHWFGYMFGDWGGCMTFALMAGQKASASAEASTAMGKPSTLQLLKTMLTNKAVGE